MNKISNWNMINIKKIIKNKVFLFELLELSLNVMMVQFPNMMVTSVKPCLVFFIFLGLVAAVGDLLLR